MRNGKDSIFIGYEELETKSNIMRFVKTNDTTLLILDKTPFYAESGGQVGDEGTINGHGFTLDVINVIKDNDTIIHVCKGEFSKPTIVNVRST